jgi:hypothetical protein
MSDVTYYFWLAGQAFEVPLLFPPAGALMFVGGAGAVLSSLSGDSGRWAQAAIAVSAPLALSAAILLCGVLLVHRSNGWVEPAPEWPGYLITGLLATHLPLGAVLVWRLREVRLFALCASVAVAGYSCGAAVMSGMSVSGQWL